LSARNIGELMLKLALYAATLVALAVVAPPLQAALEGSELWSVVNYCRAQNSAIGLPFPCLSVQPERDGQGGYVLLRSPHLKSEILLVPTERLTGVEDPGAASAAAAVYWREAWDVRRLIGERLRRQIDPGNIALAVNAKVGRTQEQLHIHIDCVRAEVEANMSAHGPATGTGWMRLRDFRGMPLWARWIGEDDLGVLNPVQAVADGVPGAKANLDLFGVAVVSARSDGASKGAYLIAVRSDARRAMSAEALLDHRCRGNVDSEATRN